MRTARRSRAVAATALVLLLTTGCAGTTDDADARPDAATTAPADAPAEDMAPGGGATPGTTDDVPPVAAVYDFTATTLDGATLEGADLAGTPTVLWFWAPWCPTCRAQIPTVSALGTDHGDAVDVVAVGGLDDADAIADLAAIIGGVTHVVDDAGEVWRHFGVTAQSTYVVLDADGEIVAEGALSDAEITDVTADLAAQG
ncbi:thiol-disulfide isomerase/thioredoxin [Isoptericola jiangsuensis]|uniref:Thiol-disulfide isomerase/thioredoxin n=1 Tax=Isoptericola jiangsuensis TaxID=548579 RepID=A0A2A9EVQ0_9MICO|nr:TlpA disulfide reductase family protein [Isoptericola jiangsuensis]PFG42239.1 thiol-disulfide isomerase/thioredoxin [Isoptericola jiangsuensis]